MKFRIAITLVLFALSLVQVQGQLLDRAALDSVRTFRSLDRAMKDPALVYRLDLSSSKLKVVPEELRMFPNLNALDLSGNKLKALPDWMAELQHVQEFRASKNKFVDYPEVVCKWVHLKRLDLSRNALTGLPKCMGDLVELVSLDLWSNDLADFPEDIEHMKELRFLDLRAIQFEQDEMDRIQELLPKAKIWFSPPCNCGM